MGKNDERLELFQESLISFGEGWRPSLSFVSWFEKILSLVFFTQLGEEDGEDSDGCFARIHLNFPNVEPNYSNLKSVTALERVNSHTISNLYWMY